MRDSLFRLGSRLGARLGARLGLAGLAACTVQKPDDTAATATGASGLLVATVAADYTIGALALLDPATGTLADDLASVSSDPGVSVDDGAVYQVNRLGFDTVRVYQPGVWSAPMLEFSTGTGSNPQSVSRCADQLYVSLFESAGLTRFDPGTGVRLGEVDLSAYADQDGLPETGSMVEQDGTLWVALQRLDRNAGWTSTDGFVVGVDCASGEVLDSFPVGPSPSLVLHPDAPELALVRTGVYYDADGAMLLDGSLSVLNLLDGSLTTLVDEATLGQNLTALAADPSAPGTALVLTSDAASVYGVHCLDLASGTLRAAETTTSFLTSALVAPASADDAAGSAWVAARPSWADPEAPGVLRSYDLDTCAPAGEPVGTTLPPYDLAWL